ncbi:hypothetical protein BC831DRAFT_481429, partial [Entophlyctis helioformis]
NLDEQKIVGPIPEQLSTFSQLDTLILSRNQFTGPIPASLAKLTKLKTLSVASNFLTGTIPSELKDLKSLRSFRFDDNPALEGPFPTGFTATLASCNGTTTDVCLGPSHSGVSCSLAACPSECGILSAAFPAVTVKADCCNNMPGITCDTSGSITAINLSNNKQIKGDFPVDLFKLKSLKSLQLDNNALTGTIPAELGTALPLLTSVSLEGNALIGRIPDTLAKLDTLKFARNAGLGGPLLSLKAGTTCTGLGTAMCLPAGRTGPACGITKKCKDCDVLAGAFPTVFSGYESDCCTNRDVYRFAKCDDDDFVTQVLLEKQGLTGSLPDVRALSKLSKLELRFNKYTGIIPEYLGNMQTLRWVDLSDNQLSGPVPAFFGNIKLLERLYLNDNLLQGTIPSSIGDLQKLEAFAFNNNYQLYNPLPESFKDKSIFFCTGAFTAVCYPEHFPPLCQVPRCKCATRLDAAGQ